MSVTDRELSTHTHTCHPVPTLTQFPNPTRPHRPDISFATYVGFDIEKLGNIPLGSFLNFSRAIPCLLSTLHAANFTQLKIKVKDIKEPTVTGFVSKGLDSLLGSTVSGAFAMLKGTLIRALPNAFETTVRDMINTALRDQMAASTTCEMPEMPQTPARFVDWQTHDMITDAKELIDGQLTDNDENGRPKINALVIEPFLTEQSGQKGTFQLYGNFFQTNTTNSPSFGAVDVRVSNLRIMGLDSIYNISLLDAVGPHTLHSDLYLGMPHPMNVTVDVFVEMHGGTVLQM